jgi:O-antigen/teichoic acid export membrane protein
VFNQSGDIITPAATDSISTATATEQSKAPFTSFVDESQHMIGRDTTKLSISREALLNIGGKFIQVVFGFAGIIVLTRLLGSDGLGRYRIVLAAGFFILSFSEDIAGIIRKRVAEIETDPEEYLSFGLIIHLGATIVTVAGLFFGRSIAVPYFGSASLTAGVVIVVASLGFFSIVNSYQAGIGYPAREMWFDSLRSVLVLCMQIAVLFLGFQAFGAIVGFGIATFATGVFIWLSIRPSFKTPTRQTVDRTFDYARYSIPSSFLGRFYQSADPLLIRSFAGANAVGYYTLASQLAQPGTLFASTISSVLAVKSSGVDSVGGDVREDLFNSMIYSGLISVPILFGAFAISDAIMQSGLFGSTFGSAPGAALVGIALMQLLTAYQRPFRSVIGGVDRPDINFRVKLLVTLIYIPTVVGLGNLYGLLGVISATVIAEAVRLLVYQYISVRIFEGVVFPKPIGHQFLAGFIMFGTVECLSRLTNPEQITMLGVLIGIGGIVYFSILLLISKHFRSTINRTFDEFK